MYFYQRIKDLREDSDKSQAEIAQKLGISRQHYSLYERGDRELPMHHFITLARFYNVSLDYLAGLTHTPRKPDGTPYSPKYNISQKGKITNNFK